MESTYHLFWECSQTRRIWSSAVQHRWIPSLRVLVGRHCLAQLIRQYRLNPNPKIIRNVAFLLWNIWKGRNELVFQNRRFNHTRILISIKKAFAEWEIRTCMSDGIRFRGLIPAFHFIFYCAVECPPRDSSNFVLADLVSSTLRQVASLSATRREI